MPDITDSVGEYGSANKNHDVALVQAMLKIVKKAGVAYLASDYDGSYGDDTKNAITKLQNDFNLAIFPEKLGKMNPGGRTIQKLNSMVPATHKPLRIIENHKTVYIEDSVANCNKSKRRVTGDADLKGGFKGNVGKVIQEFFDQHKIVLWLTPTGGRRSFGKQMTMNSNSGPGESRHQFGWAVDLGFGDDQFKWIRGDGTIKKDHDWLNYLEKTSRPKANAFWDTRDAIATNPPISLHRLRMERIHLQAFADNSNNAGRSLVKLLNTVGAMKWDVSPSPFRYKSNLGGAGAAVHVVGRAKQIWDGKATVTRAMISKATGTPVAKVTGAQVAAMKKALKADFKQAEIDWKKWLPVR